MSHKKYIILNMKVNSVIKFNFFFIFHKPQLMVHPRLQKEENEEKEDLAPLRFSTPSIFFQLRLFRK